MFGFFGKKKLSIKLIKADNLSQVDDTGHSIFTVLGRNMAADLRKVKNCAICYGELDLHLMSVIIFVSEILALAGFVNKLIKEIKMKRRLRSSGLLCDAYLKESL